MPSVYKVIFFLCITSSCVLGQSFFDKIRYQAESGIYLSTSGKTPFLMRANQYGIVPVDNPVLTFRGAVFKEYDSTYNSSNNQLNRFAIGYGVNAVANVGKINQILLPEAYVKIRYGAFEFYAGRRKEIVGLVDTTLTSGSYIWSGNALPLPKIQIAIPNYTPILGKGLISVKGAYSHGWFDNGMVKNFYLHQKYLYARIGKPNWKIKLYSGFNHQVQWGGKPATPYIDKYSGLLVSKFPTDFSTYLKVVSGISLNTTDDGSEIQVPGNEAMNRAGNHLGTIDVATEIDFKGFNLFIYRQSIYDDGSLFYLNNITDGLSGISIRRKIKEGITRVCFEYLDTRSQGGDTGSENTIPQLRGQDGYFTNLIYSDGWTYNKNIIGTPLFTQISTVDKHNISKIAEKYPSNYIINNRVQAFLVAVEGRTKKVDYTTKLIFSRNSGSYPTPFLSEASQFSFLSRIKYNLPKFSVVSLVSFDDGGLFPTSLGLYLGVQRTFL